MDIWCPACEATRPIMLGTLGHLVWLRCRSCGIDFNVPLADWDWS